MKAELVPDNGDPPIPITRDVTVIGRKAYCDVPIDDYSLSKRHCVVVKTDGLLVIRDLVTTNGTKVKGQKVRWAALLPEDRIALGGYKMRVYLGPDDVPGPSERFGKEKEKAKLSPPRKAAPVKPDPGFPVPAAVGAPSAPAEDDLEIVEDDSDDDAGWRRLLASKPGTDDNDVIIDLD